MKNKSTIVKVIVWLAVAILAIVVIGSTVFSISSNKGKHELMASASNEVPNLPSIEEILTMEENTEEWGSIVNPMDMIDEIERMTPAETMAQGDILTETSPAESTEAKSEGVTNPATQNPTEPTTQNPTEPTTQNSIKPTNPTAQNPTGPTQQVPSTGAAVVPVQPTTAAPPTTTAPVTDSKGVVTYNGQKYKYNENILSFLVLGIDNNNKVAPAKDSISGGQADAIFLAVLNQDTKKMNIISIPRDTIAAVDVYNRAGQYITTMSTYITLQHAYGDGMAVSNQRMVNAVSRLFYDLPIHGCVSINMGGIPALNDAIGGVDVQSLYTFSQGGYSFVTGENYHLEGMGAFWYLKYRDTSRHFTAEERVQRQRQYINAFYNKAMSRVKSQPTLAIDIYNTISEYMATDVSVNEVSYLASRFISGGYSFGSIRTLSGKTVIGPVYEEFHADKTALYEMILDMFYYQVQ